MKQNLMRRIITTVLVLALIIVQLPSITPMFSAHAQESLLTPQNAEWKEEALATAKWNEVEGADYYVLQVSVYVNEVLQGTTETGTTSTETDVQQQIRNLAPEGVDYVKASFCVKAQNRDKNIESTYSESSAEITYYLIAVETIETPTDVKLSEDGLVSFKQVDGAAYYTVTLCAEGDGGWVTDTTEYGYVDFGYMYLDISEFMARYYRDRGYYGETVQFYVEIEAVSTDGRASQISEKSNFVEYYIESPLHTPEFVSLEKNEDGQYIYTFKCEDEIVTYYDFQLNMEKWVNRDSDEYSEEPGGKASLTIFRIDPESNDSFVSLEEPGYYSVDISNILRGFSKSGWSLNTDYPIDIGIRIRSVFSVEGEEELYSNYSSLGTVKNYNEPALLAKIENPVIKLDGGKCILSFDAIPDAEGYDVEYHIWGNNITVGAYAEFWLDKCLIDNGTCYIDMTDILKNEVGIMECEGELLYFSLSVRAFGNKDNYEWAPYSVESNRIRCYKYGDVLENLILAPTNPIIAVGNTLYLGKTVVPDNGYYENIEWTSDNNDAISVNNEGCLTGLGEGQATITALVDNSVKVSVVANSYVVHSNIENNDEAEYIEDISGDIIDDIGNNDKPDLSHTDINEDDLEAIKEEIHSGIENGDTFHTDIKEIQKTFDAYKNNWGQIQKAAGELNVKYADSYNIDVEMYHKDKDGTVHHIGNITELENEITFTINLVGNSGNYVLVRVHKNAKGEEEYEQIDYSVNEDGSLTVKSNKFSDFIILFIDENPVIEEQIDKQKTEITISGSDREIVEGGEDFELSAKAKNEGENGSYAWASSNIDVIQINDSGKVHIVGVGESTITCSYDSDNFYGEVSIVLEVKNVEKPGTVESNETNNSGAVGQDTTPTGQTQGASGQNTTPVTTPVYVVPSTESTSENQSSENNTTDENGNKKEDKEVDSDNIVTISECNVEISLSPDDAGTVTGAGKYKVKDEVSVTVTAKEGYKFVCWKENGKKVSSDPNYSFVILKDKKLTAVFEKTTVTKTVDSKSTSVEITYDKNVKFTGEKIDPKADLDLQVNTESLEKAVSKFTKKTEVAASDVFKVSYVNKQKDNSQKGYFYVKIKTTKTAKKALAKNQLNELKELVRELNVTLKKAKCKYVIEPMDLSDPSITVKVTAKYKNNKLYTKNGKISVKSVKVVQKTETGKRTITLDENNYDIEVVNTAEGTVSISGINNYTGTVVVKAKATI